MELIKTTLNNFPPFKAFELNLSVFFNLIFIIIFFLDFCIFIFELDRS